MFHFIVNPFNISKNIFSTCLSNLQHFYEDGIIYIFISFPIKSVLNT